MKPAQEDLLKKAARSLDAARLMQENGYHDFAASRAYYTMFYTAEALLLEHGLTFSKHSAVIAAFGERFSKTGLLPTDFHRYLTEGQDSRNVGDYQIGSSLTKENAAVQIERAEKFLEVARHHLTNIPPQQNER